MCVCVCVIIKLTTEAPIGAVHSPPLPSQDRILFKSNNGGRLHGMGYSSCQSILHSDHRCVCVCRAESFDCSECMYKVPKEGVVLRGYLSIMDCSISAYICHCVPAPSGKTYEITFAAADSTFTAFLLLSLDPCTVCSELLCLQAQLWTASPTR